MTSSSVLPARAKSRGSTPAGRAVRLGKLVLACRSSARVGMGSPVKGKRCAGCKPQSEESRAFQAARHVCRRAAKLHRVEASGTSQRDARQEGGLAYL